LALPGTTTGAITTEDIFEGRFKSGIVGQVETLANCLIYIYLNPLRAGLLEGLKDTAGIRSDIIQTERCWIRIDFFAFFYYSNLNSLKNGGLLDVICNITQF
jgi:hypothetical protein